MFAICICWDIIEKCILNGTRPVVFFGGVFVFLHFILAVVEITDPYWPIINCSVFTLGFFYWYSNWLTYGESDMKSFMTHGPFRPGLKRFKSEEGNDCMAFYPVNKSIPSL
jgi:hypothetical protein